MWSDFPPLIQQQALNASRLNDAVEWPAERRGQAEQVMALSDFVLEAFLAFPEWLVEIRQNPPQGEEWQYYQVNLTLALNEVHDEDTLMRVLRQFRRRALCRIAWGQALNLFPDETVLQLLSELAEALIVAAQDWIYRRACLEWGTPCDEQGIPQPLMILAMGKLGGKELNFSSDVDLIFAYPENGSTQGGRRHWDNAQFFTRVGQRLIKVLDQTTLDGFVYRVDMRLRPFGESGPLVLSFSALEDYYQEQGRDWERYALVKARILGQSHGTWGEELQRLLRPFIYRRYIDFSVIQSLRNMKGMIAREVRRRALEENIKLGAGGIREVEFIAQVFQLIRGGREPSLQQPSLLSTLMAIEQLALLPAGQVGQLRENYLFLRRVENVLQAIADQQTQELPDDVLNRSRIAYAMHRPSWSAFHTELQQRRQEIREIFNQLIGEDDEEEEDSAQLDAFEGLWQGEPEIDELVQQLPAQTPEACEAVRHTLAGFHQDIDKRTIGPRGRDVLDQLMLHLLSETAQHQDMSLVLPRLVHLLLSIVSRTTYLELLVENRPARQQLVKLCAASSMVAHKLARYPLLLDELLYPETLYQPTPLNAYQHELYEYLLRVPSEDEEQQLESLRQFKQTHLLRIAAADISGVLPVMKVSDHLTYLAEAIIAAVVRHAWQQMVQRYGLPAHLQGEEVQGFAVLGYGKLGGWELGYGSDLDLVFLLECPAEVTTQGPRQIDGRQFYLRLAQRIMHLFSTRMTSGVLYEVDARLRPSGESGLLVTTLDAFDEYQRNEAWTWEHQALVRARMVFGDTHMQQRFRDIRQSVLSQPRDTEQLSLDVREMREKMHRHQKQSQTSRFDLKSDTGGITDIEFIAQYLVLRHAAQHPTLTRWSDNVRIFDSLAEAGIMPLAQAQQLKSVYTTLRDEIHHQALQERSGWVDGDKFAEQRAFVHCCWQQWLPASSEI